MSLKSWILIELDNDRVVRYTRDRVHLLGDSLGDTLGDTSVVIAGRGSGYTYYEYEGTAGDSYDAQGDTPGKVLADLNTILSNIDSGDTWLSFPEYDGDTYTLVRRNWDVPGDTEGALCFVRTKVKTSAISVVIVEEEPAPATIVIG